MRLKIRDFAVLELCGAADWHDFKRVEDLLSSGVDPNARFDSLESVLFGVEEDWASGESGAPPPIFFNDESEQPPLYRAAAGCSPRDNSQITSFVKVLLQCGADPYALFRQRIILHHEGYIFPGGYLDDEKESDEFLDLCHGAFARRGIIDESRRVDMERAKLEHESNPEAHSIYKYNNFEEDIFQEYDNECWINHEDRLPHPYGVRSVIHSLLEGAKFVKPIFDFLGDNLDVERRDPQGRTLFLAACLSELGLDGTVDGICTTSRVERMAENPYPQPDNPWRPFERPFTIRSTGPSMLEFFISRGANLLAVDNYGRNALHLIFSRTNHEPNRPAINDIAIKYLLKSYPSLINKPDKAGLYPLHMAIHWMGIGGHSGWTLANAPEVLYQVEVPVNDLLSAGADPLVRDGRGNTVLHYLAASKLAEKNHCVGHKQKRLLQVFLDLGVDPNARNTDGRTALNIFLTTGDDERVHYNQLNDHEGYCVLGEEVLDIFVKAGYDLEERNAAGQTLLHQVATLVSERAAAWFKVLQARGLDPLAIDKDGNTPLSFAKENDDLKRLISKYRIE